MDISEIKATIYDNTVVLVRHYYRKATRALAFAKIGFNSYDFDSYYIVELEVFKLKRMLYLFENHGHHSESCENYKPKMKSIRLAIKLGERYMNRDYFRFYDIHNKKWGKTEMGFEPIEGSTHFLMITLKNGSKYERSEQETKELLESSYADDREKDRDRRNFYRIIEKYGRLWWD